MRAQQLVNDVEALALPRVVAIQDIALLDPFFGSEIRIAVDAMHFLRKFGKH